MQDQIFEALKFLSSPEKAAFLPYFFKTGKGKYGEGDVFLGVSVPDQRKIAKNFYSNISFEELRSVLQSPFHEMRLTALLMLISKYEKAKTLPEKKKIIKFYLENLNFVNNWDLVDTSCYKILGWNWWLKSDF